MSRAAVVIHLHTIDRSPNGTAIPARMAILNAGSTLAGRDADRKSQTSS